MKQICENWYLFWEKKKKSARFSSLITRRIVSFDIKKTLNNKLRMSLYGWYIICWLDKLWLLESTLVHNLQTWYSSWVVGCQCYLVPDTRSEVESLTEAGSHHRRLWNPHDPDPFPFPHDPGSQRSGTWHQSPLASAPCLGTCRQMMFRMLGVCFSANIVHFVYIFNLVHHFCL